MAPSEAGPGEVRISRAAMAGGILLVAATIMFIAAQGVAQAGYPGYSLVNNYISDLGNTTSSPWHAAFDYGIIAYGILAFLSVLLIWGAIPARAGRAPALLLLLVASVSAVGVGVFPENVNGGLHSLFSALVFVLGGVAILILGATALRNDHRWSAPYWAYSVVTGAVMLVATALFIAGYDGPLGVGGMERLIVYPILLWAIVIGLHIARLPTFAPSALPPSLKTGS